VPRLQHLTIIPHELPTYDDTDITFETPKQIDSNFGTRCIEYWAVQDSTKPDKLPCLQNLRSLDAPETVSCFFLHAPKLTHATMNLAQLSEPEEVPVSLLNVIRSNFTLRSLSVACDLSVLDTPRFLPCAPRAFLETFLPSLKSLRKLHITFHVHGWEKVMLEPGDLEGSDYNDLASSICSESLEELIIDPMPVPGQMDVLPVLSLLHLPRLKSFVAEQPAFVYVGDEDTDAYGYAHPETQFPPSLERVGIIDSTHAIRGWAMQLLESKMEGMLPRFTEIELWTWNRGMIREPDERLKFAKGRGRMEVWRIRKDGVVEMEAEEPWKEEFVAFRDGVWERLRDVGVGTVDGGQWA
jgi:hypothetical protein